MALGTAGALLAVPGATATSERVDTSFRLVEINQSFRYIDVPPRATSETSPASPGDSFVLSERLYRQGERVGTLSGECVAVRRDSNPDKKNWLCHGVYDLAEGTLHGSAVLTFNGTERVIAIHGGTGAYEGARGTITSRPHSSGNRSIAIVRLLG